MPRQDPYPRAQWRVEIDGITRAEFVTGNAPAGTIRNTTYWSGGSRTPKVLSAGKVEFENVTLEGGHIDRQLYDWWDRCRRGRMERKTVAIIQLDESGQEVQRWNLYECWPTGWRGPEFDAGSDEVATEQLTLVYEDFEEVS